MTTLRSAVEESLRRSGATEDLTEIVIRHRLTGVGWRPSRDHVKAIIGFAPSVQTLIDWYAPLNHPAEALLDQIDDLAAAYPGYGDFIAHVARRNVETAA